MNVDSELVIQISIVEPSCEPCTYRVCIYSLDPSRTTSLVGRVMVCSLGEMSARGGLFTRGAENAKYYKLNTSIYMSLCIVMNKDNLCKTYIYRSHNMT